MIQKAERRLSPGGRTGKEEAPVREVGPGVDCRPFEDLVNLNGSAVRILRFGNRGSVILRASRRSAADFHHPTLGLTFTIGPRLFPIGEAVELTIEVPEEGSALPRTKLRIMTSAGGGNIIIEPPDGPEASGQYTIIYACWPGRVIVPKFNKATLADQLRTLSVGVADESLR